MAQKESILKSHKLFLQNHYLSYDKLIDIDKNSNILVKIVY